MVHGTVEGCAPWGRAASRGAHEASDTATFEVNEGVALESDCVVRVGVYLSGSPCCRHTQGEEEGGEVRWWV